MGEPFIGSEAVASGLVTPHALRSRFVKIHPDVYVPANTALTAGLRAQSAWLWSRRRGVVAGRSAAALYGTKWIDDRAPAELLDDYRRPPGGIHTWSDRLGGDEIQTFAGMPVRSSYSPSATEAAAALPTHASRCRLSTRAPSLPAKRGYGFC